MKPTYLLLACLTFLSMAVLAIALLGGKIDPLPAATLGTGLFVALMHFSGKIDNL